MAHHHNHYSGDPHALSGFWGPPTSAMNFCEEDYAVTQYAAEFISTTTNLIYVYFALRYPRKNDEKHPSKGLDILSWSLLGVGIFSVGFHATLNQTAQFCDDISMLVFSAALLQKLYTSGHSPLASKLISAVLFSVTAIVSIAYLRNGNILLHFYTFSTMVSLIWPRTLYLIHARGRSETERKNLARRFWSALGTLVVAFIIWNIDLEKCMELRQIRAAVGLPWAWLFEFHGWWHILTGIGAKDWILLVRDLCGS
ncbi:alkaline phytoceramidase [Pseudomassariella vexata]|uniref:Alkaline phytoceramidase n=1 Tax=Pseudomassariella vexata TaxID=1141098 RepID=A0A1Y2DC59_9PEZI|nr:alkaline phytoceramidase [Pseudomassariella vexata]ORY56851.1 alkaline phytoceramidase [Pseudomassariella vexata]